MREVLRDMGVRSRIEVAPIWVELPDVRPEPEQPSVQYSGSLGRKQGALQLVAVAEVLAQRRPPVPLVVRGDGPLRQPLCEALAARGLSNVAMEPLAPRELLFDALAGGTLHVVPQAAGVSDAAVPSKVFNIMAAGRPAVVGAAPGSAIADLARRSGGLVVTPPGDAAALAAAGLALLDDPDRRLALATAGRDYVQRHHEREAVLGRVGGLLLADPESDSDR
jgi:colanic acid biosynthesis glycosyl transferase WcaI